MTNEQILKKVIEKTVRNGMHDYRWLFDKNTSMAVKEMIEKRGHYVIIFSHDFAKAFWGNEYKTVYLTSELAKAIGDEQKLYKQRVWMFHLQQMVLEPEPLKYLRKFLDG